MEIPKITHSYRKCRSGFLTAMIETGKSSYAKASVDSQSWLTHKTTGEASCLVVRLEASSIEVSNCDGTPIRYRVYFSFIIITCYRLLTGLTISKNMRLEASSVEASPIEASSVVYLYVNFLLSQFRNFGFAYFYHCQTLMSHV